MATHKITNVAPTSTSNRYRVTFDVTAVLTDGVTTQLLPDHIYEFDGPAANLVAQCQAVADHDQAALRAREAAAAVTVPADILALIGS